MVFKDVEDKLLMKIFYAEYCNAKTRWPEFIKHKDLGIEDITDYNDERNTGSTYKIINQKKWLLAKMKYGL